MIINIIIFFIAITLAFGMLFRRAWQVKNSSLVVSDSLNSHIIKIPFRKVEKFVLYSTKHIIQLIIINGVKYWFILTTKTKKKIIEDWPKVHNYFLKINKKVKEKNNTFVHRAIVESRVKIRNIKEKVKKENSID